MPGIKETSDVVRAVGAALAVYNEAVKDGLDLGDLGLLTDQQFLDQLDRAFNGIEDVPGELNDLSWSEILQLVRNVASQLG